MLRPVDQYFLQHEEPAKSCLQFLRKYILSCDPAITEGWAYGLPFYYYKGKRFVYLWIHKKQEKPYLGFVDGNKIDDPRLLAENRSRMKIFLVDPGKNIPVKEIGSLLKKALALYK